ncbi:MAG: hypothetical protein IJ901_08465 [Bacteroidaceae bacterium]|nr:hypothetical protein [Bacteroidaceae bacterium]
MKTKMMIAACVMLFATTSVMNAQDNNGGRQRQRMNPTEMYTRTAERLAKQMKLDDDKTNSFKVLYLDYQTARTNAANPKGENTENERVDMEKMTNEQATELVQKRFQAQEAQLAVDKEYYTKFLEILTPVQAAQIFIQRGGNFRGMAGMMPGGAGRGMGGGRGGNGGRSGGNGGFGGNGGGEF